jgi:hypothetical protein
MSPLHAAELDYEALCRRAPGVTRADVDTDLMRLELIAASVAETARKAWRECRAMNDVGPRPEFELAAVARQIADVIAANLGLSREAALVLDERAKGAFA